LASTRGDCKCGRELANAAAHSEDGFVAQSIGGI
jgi:hypothetical protein